MQHIMPDLDGPSEHPVHTNPNPERNPMNTIIAIIAAVIVTAASFTACTPADIEGDTAIVVWEHDAEPYNLPAGLTLYVRWTDAEPDAGWCAGPMTHTDQASMCEVDY